MIYLDLAELSLLRGSLRLFGSRRAHPLAFIESDHQMQSTGSLEEEIRTLIAEKAGKRPTGPIRLLTLLRTWGYYFSPLNLYYCFDQSGDSLETIVAEVSNTPWRECHRYVLFPLVQGATDEFSCEHEKDFHVSPFMPMEQRYRWRCSQPASSLRVQIATQQADTAVFTADMNLMRKPLNDAALAWSLCSYPWITARIVSAIYWQAFHLWWRKCPFYTHPKKRVLRAADTQSFETNSLKTVSRQRTQFRP